MEQKTYWNDAKLSYLTEQEVEEEIQRLAGLYVPQWHYDFKNPDIGVAIAKIFAKQMGGNLKRYYQVLDKYHEEFINMMGLSLSPAKPAYSVVHLQVAEDTISGMKLYKGTKFLAQTEEEPLIFESQHNLYLTNSRLDTIFMTEEKTGKIIPVRGEMKPVSYLPEQDNMYMEDEGSDYFPFPLFGSDRKGIEQNILLIGHSSALDIENPHHSVTYAGGANGGVFHADSSIMGNNSIYLRIHGNELLTHRIEEGDFEFMYYTKEGLLPVEECRLLEDGITFEIKKEKENEKLFFEKYGEQSILALIAKYPVLHNYEISSLGISSKGSPVAPERVSNALVDLPAEKFDLFSDTLSLFQECYIGHNAYFEKAGAMINISFKASFRENRITTVQAVEEENLKIIKRKRKNTYVEVFSHVYPEEISIEYFNGIGWKKLETTVPVGGLFSEGKEGEYEISFICPGDWQDTQVGSYQGKCIKIQLLKATDCYLRPAIHHYPQIRELNISYNYGEEFMEPDYLQAVMGTMKADLTPLLKSGDNFCIFAKGRYDKDSLYLGFDKKIESGPVSIYFRLQKELPLFQGTFKFEYSTMKGFRQMKVVDGTKGMSNSGTVLFIPPSDFKEMELEGRKLYWIRITPSQDRGEEGYRYFPVIEEILVNVAEVANIETREEEDYYLEEVGSGLTIPLGTDNILDVDLWVNEMGQHSRFQMQTMEREYPDKIRIEYDHMGEVTSFFVKWEETAVLEHATNPRSYALDRLYGVLQFGDGIHTRIPKVLDDISFKLQIRCCQGQKGNVEMGSITESMDNLMFVNQIYNPVRGYGGSNMERVEKALKRGSGLLRNRGRMVSAKDYIEEIINYSDRIDKVKCITGIRVTGEEDPAAVNFVLLLKDYSIGGHSFRSISEEIKARLLAGAELTIQEKDLHIIEPVFVELSVDAWVETGVSDQGFEIQTLLQESLEQFLNPLSGEHSFGREMGIIPRKNEIGVLLTRVKKEAMIRKIVVTAVYYDHEGRHETDLDELEPTPFMVCCNGTHRIHVF